MLHAVALLIGFAGSQPVVEADLQDLLQAALHPDVHHGQILSLVVALPCKTGPVNGSMADESTVETDMGDRPLHRLTASLNPSHIR